VRVARVGDEVVGLGPVVVAAGLGVGAAQRAAAVLVEDDRGVDEQAQEGEAAGGY
jgi:hypothetical protein